MREYTNSQTTIANLPYMAMILLGVITIILGFDFVGWTWIAGIAYFVYGIIGAFWIMIFVCPYCTYYATRGCPCGYGIIAAKIVHKGSQNCFSEKFRRHIPVIVPLWFIPVIFGGIALYQSFSLALVGLIAVFAVNSYIVLPLVSTQHSCKECPQKDDCPWMVRQKQPA